MKRIPLEILSLTDLNISLSNLDKRELILEKGSYNQIKEWDTPYIKAKNIQKFHRKINDLIIQKGEEIKADLAIIKFTNTYYPDMTANQNVVFYIKKQSKSLKSNFLFTFYETIKP